MWLGIWRTRGENKTGEESFDRDYSTKHWATTILIELIEKYRTRKTTAIVTERHIRDILGTMGWYKVEIK